MSDNKPYTNLSDHPEAVSLLDVMKEYDEDDAKDIFLALFGQNTPGPESRRVIIDGYTLQLLKMVGGDRDGSYFVAYEPEKDIADTLYISVDEALDSTILPFNEEDKA